MYSQYLRKGQFPVASPTSHSNRAEALASWCDEAEAEPVTTIPLPNGCERRDEGDRDQRGKRDKR